MNKFNKRISLIERKIKKAIQNIGFYAARMYLCLSAGYFFEYFPEVSQIFVLGNELFNALPLPIYSSLFI